MAALADALMVNTKQEAPQNANAPGGTGDREVSNFVTAQSFATFAIAVPVLKTIWELIKALAGGWADSYWTPVVIAVIYGVWQLTISLTGDKGVRGVANVFSVIVVGAANAGVLAAAIIGLTETTGVGE